MINGVSVVVTIAPNNIEKIPFQPVTTTLFPSAALPAILSSVSVPRKTSQETTCYIIPRVHIEGRDFINATCSSNGYQYLSQITRDPDKSCHLYLMVTGKLFVMNSYNS